MSIFTNPFIEVVNSFNGLTNQPTTSTLSTEMQQRRQKRTVSMYLTMRTVMAQVQELLAPDEKIINLLPMTDESNSAAATGGVMGMYVPKTDTTKAYMKDQASLRGNRLMVFTNERIIFFIVIEFLDDPKQYFSYNYDQLPSVKLVDKRVSFPSNENFWKRAYMHYYSVDFETSDKHVFTEFLTKQNGELFKQNLLTIPGLANTQVTNGVTRANKFDYLFSNVSLATKVLYIGLPILLGLLFVFSYLSQFFD